VATCTMSPAVSGVIPVGSKEDQDNLQRRSERTLVQRAQGGDQEAFADLFKSHSKRVYSVCLQMTKTWRKQRI